MTKQAINVTGAPAAKGPYSHAVLAGGMLYVSGQGPLDPQSGEVVRGGVAEEARQTLENLKRVVEGAGGRMSNVVKTTCYLANMDDFQEFNTVYAEYFDGEKPARTTIQAGRLPLGIRVEIDAVVVMD